MVTLRVIVDAALERSPRGLARYTEELTSALIATAPRNCDVEGITASASEEELARLRVSLPGLSHLTELNLGRRELYAAWNRTITTLPLHGMVHGTTLLAPLRSHDRGRSPGDQTVVTIHDTTAWRYPESRRSRWVRHMAARAKRHADAIVVPTHAVAAELERLIGFGDRLRVIGGAVSSSLALPSNPAETAARLGLPPEYLLSVSGMQPHKGLEVLLQALALPSAPDVPLVHVGPDRYADATLQEAIARSGLPAERVRHLGIVTDSELAVVLDRASALVAPSLSEGFGLAMVEAFSFGTPVISSDSPALVEVADGAAVVVPREPADRYPERLAAALSKTLSDTTLLARLEVSGLDRAKAYSWRDSAERVWQLHADL
jgi:glycosyltransferase involved in cell wall biosynthesis